MPEASTGKETRVDDKQQQLDDYRVDRQSGYLTTQQGCASITPTMR